MRTPRDRPEFWQPPVPDARLAQMLKYALVRREYPMEEGSPGCENNIGTMTLADDWNGEAMNRVKPKRVSVIAQPRMSGLRNSGHGPICRSEASAEESRCCWTYGG